MFDKVVVGLEKAGKATVEIVKDWNFQIGVLNTMPVRLLSSASKIKKEMNSLQLEIQELKDRIVELEKKKANDGKVQIF